MLLIIFLGLITNLALVSGDCSVGTGGEKDFDYSKVGIDVLKQETRKPAAWVYTSFVALLTKYQLTITDCVLSSNMIYG